MAFSLGGEIHAASILCLLFSLGLASSASAVTMDWTLVGNPGNARRIPPRFGAVGYAYSIGTYEVTNSQYAEFLNAKAASDPLGLYNTGMGSGIRRHHAQRRVGQLHLQPDRRSREHARQLRVLLRLAALRELAEQRPGRADTETGAYTLLGGTPTPSNGATVTRNAGATIVLTSENEWYKAAYYDAPSASYFDYPAGSNTQTTCSAPTATPNRANCRTPSATSRSRAATRARRAPMARSTRAATSTSGTRRSSAARPRVPRRVVLQRPERPRRVVPAQQRRGDRNFVQGFRVALVPEPGTGLLVIAGLIGLAFRRR